MTLTQILQKIRAAFYTKAETDNLLSGKSNTNHNHNSAYLGKTAKAESAKSADSVAWANVSGKPTKVSQFTNDSGYLTSGNVVDRTSNQSINGDKTFNNVIQTNSGLFTKDNIILRIQNIDNNETNPTGEIGSCAIGFTDKNASAWWAYNRYIRTTADGTAYLNLLCHPIKKSDGSYTVGGYINIYNTGFARVNDPLKMDPHTTWNNNNIVTANWVRKYFSNSIGNYWNKSATVDTQYSHSTFSYLSPIDKATTNTSWSIYKPFRIVDKNNSIELGYVEYGYKSDLAYTRLATHHNNGGWFDFTIHSNGISYFNNCKELWLVNRNLNSYNTPPSNEVDTQIWFMDKNTNKYATLQTDYYTNGVRQFALTHKSLKTNTWIGLNIKTSPTDDVIQCQPRFQAQDSIVVHNTDSNVFTQISQGWIELSQPNYCCIDFKHAGNQDYLGRIGLNPANILYLETINGAPIMANGKNIVRSVNGMNADNNGNVTWYPDKDNRGIYYFKEDNLKHRDGKMYLSSRSTNGTWSVNIPREWTNSMLVIIHQGTGYCDIKRTDANINTSWYRLGCTVSSNVFMSSIENYDSDHVVTIECTNMDDEWLYMYVLQFIRGVYRG